MHFHSNDIDYHTNFPTDTFACGLVIMKINLYYHLSEASQSWSCARALAELITLQCMTFVFIGCVFVLCYPSINTFLVHIAPTVEVTNLTVPLGYREFGKHY